MEVPNGNGNPGTFGRRGDSIDRMKLLDIKMLVAVTETSHLQRLLQIREHGELHLRQRGAQAAPVLAAVRAQSAAASKQATPNPSAIIGKGRSRRQ
jgi:hypothetical protein